MATTTKAALWGDNDLQTLWNQAYPSASAADNPGTLASGQSDVDKMTVRDRLWDSMNYTYGQQRRASDQAYANAISQQDRQALSHGMQRSSYNAATQANMRNQQVQAGNNIYAQQIADYEKQLYQIERDQVADQQWQTQFDESVRQFNILHPQVTGGGGGGGGSVKRSRGSGSSRDRDTDDDRGEGDGTSGLWDEYTDATSGTGASTGIDVIKPTVSSPSRTSILGIRRALYTK